jgi:hypothetical protein
MSDYCTLSDIYAQLPESGLASSTDYTAGLSMMITAASLTPKWARGLIIS